MTPFFAAMLDAWAKYGNEIVVTRKLEGVNVGTLQQVVAQSE